MCERSLTPFSSHFEAGVLLAATAFLPVAAAEPAPRGGLVVPATGGGTEAVPIVPPIMSPPTKSSLSSMPSSSFRSGMYAGRYAAVPPTAPVAGGAVAPAALPAPRGVPASYAECACEGEKVDTCGQAMKWQLAPLSRFLPSHENQPPNCPPLPPSSAGHRPPPPPPSQCHCHRSPQVSKSEESRMTSYGGAGSKDEGQYSMAQIPPFDPHLHVGQHGLCSILKAFLYQIMERLLRGSGDKRTEGWEGSMGLTLISSRTDLLIFLDKVVQGHCQILLVEYS